MSEGLEALELLKALPKALSIGCETTMGNFFAHEFAVIEKELKVLEIIKEKKVNVGVLIHHITDKYLPGLKSYNFMWGGTPEKQLTQEEYDLLKEVLL